MQLGNCVECGKLCIKTPRGYCHSCQQARYEAEEKVAQYLYDFPQSTIDQVHKATNVAKRIIRDMVRMGRIIEGTLLYHCESCNAEITSGRICEKCTAALEIQEPENEIWGEEVESDERTYGYHSQAHLK